MTLECLNVSSIVLRVFYMSDILGKNEANVILQKLLKWPAKNIYAH